MTDSNNHPAYQLEAVPVPPDALSNAARQEWITLATTLFELKTARPADLRILELLCELLAEITLLQETIRRGVLTPSLVVSFSHTDTDIDYTIDAFNGALDIYKQALADGVEQYLVGRPSQTVYRKYNSPPVVASVSSTSSTCSSGPAEVPAAA